VIYFKRAVYARALDELAQRAFPDDPPQLPEWSEQEKNLRNIANRRKRMRTAAAESERFDDHQDHDRDQQQRRHSLNTRYQVERALAARAQVAHQRITPRVIARSARTPAQLGCSQPA
jgi:hypothetical protein